jgi:protein SCO1/2
MRRWIWPIILAALVLVLGAGVMLTELHPGKSGVADIGGPFTLTDQHGHTVTEADLKGKPTLLFFGFTYCPDVCPTTLAHMSAWLKALGPDADRVNVVYVTIDPERDTRAVLAAYLKPFDPRILGLTGTPAQIAQIAREYRVYYKKIPLEGGGYTMDHSAVIYGLDRHGQFDQTLSYEEPDAKAVAAVKAMIAA